MADRSRDGPPGLDNPAFCLGRRQRPGVSSMSCVRRVKVQKAQGREGKERGIRFSLRGWCWRPRMLSPLNLRGKPVLEKQSFLPARVRSKGERGRVVQMGSRNFRTANLIHAFSLNIDHMSVLIPPAHIDQPK